MPVILYALIEARTDHPNFGKPLYVGIGAENRPYAHIRHAKRPEGCRNKLLTDVLRAHLAVGVEPWISVLATFETRAEADEAERAAITKYGRMGRDQEGILCNVAHGGDGPDSAIMDDPEVRANIARASHEYWSTPEHRAAQAERTKTGHARPDVREHISETTKAALNNEEVRAKHVAALKRINAAMTTEQRRAAETKRSPEGRAASGAHLKAMRRDASTQAKRRKNSSAPQLASWQNPEIRAKRIAAMKGKKKTPSEAGLAARRANGAKGTAESNAKKGAAAKAMWADPAFKAKMAEKRKASWQDPQKRAAMLEGRSEGIAKSWNDPATRARRIAGIKAASESVARESGGEHVVSD